MLHIESDPVADAVYIQFLDEPVGYTKELDENRVIDYTLNPGLPIGIDLLAVSDGVKLNDLPEVEMVEKVLQCLGVKCYSE
ncbi:DUF2283 domain-containing protein [Chloroflexota bacterium]